MLTEPPGEALVRTSTYTASPGRPGRMDLTTVYEQPWTSTAVPAGAKGSTPAAAPGGSAIVPGRPLHTKAIYQIDGDRLTYCVAAPGKPRPTGWATTKGDGLTLVSLRRLVVAR